MDTEAVDPANERFNDLLIALERLELQIRGNPTAHDPILDAALDRLQARFDRAVMYQRSKLEENAEKAR